MQELADLHDRGNTIIMVTHNPRLTSYATRIIKMLDGRIDTDSHIRKKTAKSAKRPLGQNEAKTT
jgi:putative ABC transport system ATP-binding protein